MSKFTDRLATKGIVVMDTTTGQDLWSQLTSTRPPYTSTTFEDPFETRLKEIENQMQLVQLELKLSRLKILSLEGKFKQEEIANIRKMLMSEDEASRTVAESILQNS